MAKEPKKKMGRPLVINDDDFDEFIRLPLPRYDIAKILRCSDDALDVYCRRRFNQTFKAVQDQNRQVFKGRILAKQYELAMAGSIPLLIWLGKNYCDQVDTRKIEGSEEKPLNLVYSPNAIKDAIEVKQIGGQGDRQTEIKSNSEVDSQDGRQEGQGSDRAD